MSNPETPCDRCDETTKEGEEVFRVTVVHLPSDDDPRLIPEGQFCVCGGCYLQLRGTTRFHTKVEVEP